MKLRKSIHTETEEIRAEPTSPLHDKTEEEWPKITRKPTRVYQLPYKNEHHMHTPKAMQKLTVEMLYLRRFKEALILNGIHLLYVKSMLNSWEP